MKTKQLIELGLTPAIAEDIVQQINIMRKTLPPKKIWQKISKEVLTPDISFPIHLFLFQWLYPDWPDHLESGPVWIPDSSIIADSNLMKSMKEIKLNSIKEFHHWSVTQYDEFIKHSMEKLRVVFHKKPTAIIRSKDNIETPEWLVDAKMNIVDSCFSADPQKIAILFQQRNGPLTKMSYAELDKLSNQIANSLVQQHFSKGDAIAINMPMTTTAVAIYLGIIKMGGIVVSIADSFSAEEIATRLNIANTKAIFTQDVMHRNEKIIPLYEKIMDAQAPKTIVIPANKTLAIDLRKDDIAWNMFLVNDAEFNSVSCQPDDDCNILFSSGTTGTPKAIPWTHATPLKAAMDAYFHHDIQENDTVAWPTNLGWMMGPWLVFAGLMNHATIALYDGMPTDRAFGKFIQDARVTMLGVIPTLVAKWRQTKCMEGLDWSRIRLFSSTGECSNPEDMFYLMWLAGYKPIIEYCGGTEIGGGYITSTIIEDNYPSLLNTPAFGLDFLILDEEGKSTKTGEVALVPPAMGLSTRLINANHHDIYFSNMPTIENGRILRRHGDQIRRLSEHYCMLGRMDDTMNLGGIKVSSAEIERSLVGIEDIIETAAIAYSPRGHGPSQLIIYAATSKNLDKNLIMNQMQLRINQHLNPLFKIHDIVFVSELPKTASNKIMRRMLRASQI